MSKTFFPMVLTQSEDVRVVLTGYDSSRQNHRVCLEVLRKNAMNESIWFAMENVDETALLNAVLNGLMDQINLSAMNDAKHRGYYRAFYRSIVLSLLKQVLLIKMLKTQTHELNKDKEWSAFS